MRPPSEPAGGTAAPVAFLLALALALATATAPDLCGQGKTGQGGSTTDAALQRAFPGADIERRPITLDEKQRAAVAKLCGQAFDRSIVFAYTARRKGAVVGTGWFDVHRVRSKRQLVMIAITPQHTVHRVEVLMFHEPQRYAVPRSWLQRLEGRAPGQVQPGRDVPRITGSTITVSRTAECVDRYLALSKVLFPGAESPPDRENTKDPKSSPPPKPGGDSVERKGDAPPDRGEGGGGTKQGGEAKKVGPGDTTGGAGGDATGKGRGS